MPGKTEIEELIFLKEGTVADKNFYIFQNQLGELRAVEKERIDLNGLKKGDKLKAKVSKKGCAGREIEQLFPAF